MTRWTTRARAHKPKPAWRSGVAFSKIFAAQLTAFGELAFRMEAQLRSYGKTVGDAPQFTRPILTKYSDPRFFECRATGFSCNHSNKFKLEARN